MTEKPEADEKVPEKAEAKEAADDFADQAQESNVGFFREFGEFLLYNKKWWLTPIIIVLLLISALLLLGGSAAAPFIYTLW